MRNFEKDFRKWFWNAVPTINHDVFTHSHTPFSMQWGVYVDFFDAEGIFLSASRISPDDGSFYEVKINGRKLSTHPDLELARKSTVGKAIEIYEKTKP